MVAVVVEAPPGVLADIVAVIGQHRDRLGEAVEFLRQHEREQVLLAAEVVYRAAPC
jgi:hypothetical protein